MLPNINPIQAALRPSCSAFASCPPVRGQRIRRSRRCSCFRQTYSNWNPQTTAFRPRGRRATTSSSRASSSFRLITALRPRGHWGISWTQIKDTRPSKPTTSNVRFWQRLPTLSAMATSISWEALRVAVSSFDARWILRAALSAGGMSRRDHISKRWSAFPGPLNCAIGPIRVASRPTSSQWTKVTSIITLTSRTSRIRLIVIRVAILV